MTFALSLSTLFKILRCVLPFFYDSFLFRSENLLFYYIITIFGIGQKTFFFKVWLKIAPNPIDKYPKNLNAINLFFQNIFY